MVVSLDCVFGCPQSPERIRERRPKRDGRRAINQAAQLGFKGQPPGTGQDNRTLRQDEARAAAPAQDKHRDGSRAVPKRKSRLEGERSASGPSEERRQRVRESRHSSTFFPLSGHDPAGSSSRAGNADRAFLYDFRRFPTVILATDSPLGQHHHSPRSFAGSFLGSCHSGLTRAPQPARGRGWGLALQAAHCGDSAEHSKSETR